MKLLEFLTGDEVSQARDRAFQGYEAYLGVPQAEADKALALAQEAEADAEAAAAESQAEAVKTIAIVLGGVAVAGLVVWLIKSR